jgi:hypothetical protein
METNMYKKRRHAAREGNARSKEIYAQVALKENPLQKKLARIPAQSAHRPCTARDWAAHCAEIEEFCCFGLRLT